MKTLASCEGIKQLPTNKLIFLQIIFIIIIGESVKKASTLLLAFLTLVLAGLFTYTVYATLTATISFSNRISFTSYGVYFKANIKIVNPENESVILCQGTINNSGDDFSVEPNPITHYLDLNFGNAISFSQAHPTIRYIITIENYSEFDIDASFTLPVLDETQSEYITNIARVNNIVVDRMIDSNTRDSGILQMDTTCSKFTKSFAIDNSFDISITQRA